VGVEESSISLVRGDIVRMTAAGGGGYGEAEATEREVRT